ncbi:hypothetical protein MBLNU459_g6333t1 [Dothideomycetes sp. NU459]
MAAAELRRGAAQHTGVKPPPHAPAVHRVQPRPQPQETPPGFEQVRRFAGSQTRRLAGSQTGSFAGLPHAAQEVFVTGTFDNWSKTVQLERHGNAFHKTVDLPAEKTYYKFVVDGNWTTDHTIAQETDESGNVNNVLTADDLKSAPSSHSFLSSAAPASSTSALAASQPLTGKREMDDTPAVAASRQPAVRNESFVTDIPGSFPQTPGLELNQFSVNPIPATEGAGNPIKLAPGEPVPHPSTFTSNTVESTIRSDPSLKSSEEDGEQVFGVAPIPATEGAGNPIKLAPGEPVPHPSTFNSNTVESTVRSDPSLKSSAEDSERVFGVAPIPATGGIGNPVKLAPGEPVPDPSTITGNTIHSTVSDMRSETGAPVLPPVLTPRSEEEAAGGSMFNLPSVGGTMIPESSLPMGSGATSYDEPSFTTSSAGGPTTAALAGAVPIRERGVPEVVTESQDSANFGREAAGNATVVEEKSALEEELKAVVPEAPATSEAFGTGNASAVPSAVTASQNRADVDPEATADPTAVSDKAAVEDELKQVVPEQPATSESGIFGKSERGITGAIAGGAAAAGAALAAGAYAARDKAAEYTQSQPAGTAGTQAATTSSVGNSVPEEVLESQAKAHASPEASASPEAVREKSAMEQELKATVPEEPTTSESGVFGKSEGGISGQLAAGAAAATGAAAAGAYAARDKVAEYTRSQPTASSTTAVGNGVPAPVVDSQLQAHASPEASASVEAVREKSAMEQELKSTVPEEPATAESGVFGKSEGGISGQVAAGAAAATGLAAAGAYAARDKAAEATGSDKHTFLPASVQSAIDNMNTYGTSNSTTPVVAAAGSPSATATEAAVPEVVTESQREANFQPEASAEPEVVAEKTAVEKELLAKVPTAEESGEPAPTASAALTETAPVTTTSAATSSIPAADSSAISGVAATSSIPEPKSSGLESKMPASATPVASSEAASSAVPAIKTADSTTDAAAASTGLNAPADSQAQSVATKTGSLAAQPLNDSRDVSPMSRPGAREPAPVETAASEAAPAPKASTPAPTPQATPQKTKRASSFFRGTPESNRTSMSHASEASKDGEGKPKKKGFLSKLKEKFKN